MGRKREPLIQERLPDLPVWVHDRFGRVRAHLAIAEGVTRMGSLGVELACAPPACRVQVARFFDLAHPDDVKCKKCLAWERKHKEE